MERMTFIFQDNEYTGYLMSSTNELPHYHWFFLEDETLIAKVGDCISFSPDDKGIIQLNHQYKKENQELVAIIQQLVESLINSGTSES